MRQVHVGVVIHGLFLTSSTVLRRSSQNSDKIIHVVFKTDNEFLVRLVTVSVRQCLESATHGHDHQKDYHLVPVGGW